MAERQQENPLAPESHRIAITDDTNTRRSTQETVKKNRFNKKFLHCCGCATTFLIIIGIVLLVLFLTVFKVKDPKINLNKVTIKGLEGVNPTNLVPNTNLTIIADVSVKNPNIASFKFKNSTTGIYYENVLIGEATFPHGNARAKKTFKLNVTIDFLLQKIVSVPRLVSDLTAGSLPISTQTSIRGRVKIIEIVKKTVGVKMDCNVTVIIANQTIQDQKCTKSVKL